ncbi:hypothetical protein [Polyangium sp. 6x1]|uniref:hypothetical protein n=1 Tax=Polyangium sp. 6x1 TaxID=3042689 RepID=UPI00248274EA|nr:hypothetical protein [Polyangium sp. 6x1]MDI1450642.1 hypothetical protein [Polyangium sp. 6x1]
MPRARALAPLLCLALLVPATASADDDLNRVAFRFDYTPPRTIRGCMGREDFIMWLASGFGYSVVRDDARALVRVELKRDGREIEAHVSALDEHGAERWKAVIPTPLDCRELVQDAAYAIALNLGRWELRKEPTPEWLLLRPQIEVGSPAPSPALRPFVAYDDDGPLRQRTPDPFYQVTTIPAPPTNPSESQGPMFEVGATVLVVPYGLPAVGFGGAGTLALRWPRFSILGEMRGVTSLEATAIGTTVTRATIWSGVFGLCANARIGLHFCGVASLGRLFYSTNDEFTFTDPIAFNAMLGARAGGTWRVADSFALRGFVEGMVPLGDNRLRIDRPGEPLLLEPTKGLLFGIGLGGVFDLM